MLHQLLTQAENGGIYLSIAGNKTLLRLKQLIELRINLNDLPDFNQTLFEVCYGGNRFTTLDEPVNYGLHPDDKIIKQHRGSLIIETNGIIQVVDPFSGTRFIIDLDDSKRAGNRTSLGMTYDEQFAAAVEYIGRHLKYQFDRLTGSTH